METLINIYIIEDNLMHKKVIMNKLEDYSNNSDFAKFNIVDIQNHIDFYHNLYVFPILSTDIFIIDIDLNTFFTGIQLAQKIRALHPYTYIIFLTGDSSNGIKVINDQIKPLAYLLKQDLQETVLNQEFYFILNQVEKNININKEDFLIVRSGTNQFIFRFSEIHYVASLKTKKRQVIVKTTNQEIVCDEKIITLKKELKPNNFYKDMKSFIINFDFVSSYNSLEGTITFRDQTELTFSKKVISKFGKAIIDYRSGGV